MSPRRAALIREKAREIAEATIGGHYYVDEDCWYSCGAHPDCCNEESLALGCTCGRARRVEKLTGDILTMVELGIAWTMASKL